MRDVRQQDSTSYQPHVDSGHFVSGVGNVKTMFKVKRHHPLSPQLSLASLLWFYEIKMIVENRFQGNVPNHSLVQSYFW